MGGRAMTRHGRACLLGVLAGSLLVFGEARPAGAQVSGRLNSPRETQALLDSWQHQYQEIFADLKAGKHASDKQARKTAIHLFNDVVDRGVSGETLCKIAGNVLTVMAVAEARLGDPRAAAWHWQMAQNVSADVRDFDFADFPDVAAFMKENLIPEKRWDVFRPHATSDATPPPLKAEPDNVEPPELEKKVPPRYPTGLLGLRIGQSTTVEAFIDTKGWLRGPIVRRSCGHVSFDLAAMESLKEWRYKPATRNGEPIEVYLNVTIAFVPQQ